MALYRYNPETKEMDCISTRNGKTREHIYMPRDTAHSGHFFENLDCHIRDKEHKRQVMDEQGVYEAG